MKIIICFHGKFVKITFALADFCGSGSGVFLKAIGMVIFFFAIRAFCFHSPPLVFTGKQIAALRTVEVKSRHDVSPDSCVRVTVLSGMAQKKRCTPDLYTLAHLPQRSQQYKPRNAPCKKHGTNPPYLLWFGLVDKVVVCKGSPKNLCFNLLFYLIVWVLPPLILQNMT